MRFLLILTTISSFGSSLPVQSFLDVLRSKPAVERANMSKGHLVPRALLDDHADQHAEASSNNQHQIAAIGTRGSQGIHALQQPKLEPLELVPRKTFLFGRTEEKIKQQENNDPIRAAFTRVKALYENLQQMLKIDEEKENLDSHPLPMNSANNGKQGDHDAPPPPARADTFDSRKSRASKASKASKASEASIELRRRLTKVQKTMSLDSNPLNEDSDKTGSQENAEPMQGLSRASTFSDKAASIRSALSPVDRYSALREIDSISDEILSETMQLLEDIEFRVDAYKGDRRSPWDQNEATFVQKTNEIDEELSKWLGENEEDMRIKLGQPVPTELNAKWGDLEKLKLEMIRAGNELQWLYNKGVMPEASDRLMQYQRARQAIEHIMNMLRHALKDAKPAPHPPKASRHSLSSNRVTEKMKPSQIKGALKDMLHLKINKDNEPKPLGEWLLGENWRDQWEVRVSPYAKSHHPIPEWQPVEDA